MTHGQYKQWEGEGSGDISTTPSPRGSFATIVPRELGSVGEDPIPTILHDAARQNQGSAQPSDMWA